MLSGGIQLRWLETTLDKANRLWALVPGLAVAVGFSVNTVVSAESVVDSKSESLTAKEKSQATSFISLFMSAEEQQAAELRRLQNTSQIDEVSKQLATEITEITEAVEALSINNTPEPVLEEHEAAVDSAGPPRYNGVVLRGSAVLGLWVGEERFSMSEGSDYLSVKSVSSNGQATFTGTQQSSSERRTALLNPGDLIPFGTSDPVFQNHSSDSRDSQ